MTRNRIKYFGTAVCLILLMTAMKGVGQQDPQHTQFMWDQSSLNPAYTGIEESLSSSLFLRQQWLGIEGAPKSEYVSIHTPIMNRQGGVGAVVWHDQIGINNQLRVKFQGAYNLRLSKGYLRFGLSAEWMNWSMKWTDTSPDEGGDLSIPDADLSENALNGGFGMMYHTDLLYVGFSIPNLMENQWVFDSDETNAFATMEESRHYYLNAGRAFKLNPKLILKPAMMVRYVQGAPIQTDVNASFLFNKTLWVGASYRLGDSVDLLFEYTVTRQLTIGYSFDFTLSKLQNHQGSHELFLGFNLEKKKDGFNHPRFF